MPLNRARAKSNNNFQLPASIKAAASSADYFIGIDKNNDEAYRITLENLLADTQNEIDDLLSEIITLQSNAQSLEGAINSISNLEITTSANSALIAKNAALRHIGYRSGRYYPIFNYNFSSSSGTTGAALNAICYYPFKIESDITIDRITIFVAGAISSSSLRIGIFNSLNGVPSDLVADFGILNTTTTGPKEAIINLNLAAGWYWIAAIAIGATPNLTLGGNANPDLIKLLGSTTPVFSAGSTGYRVSNSGSTFPLVAVLTSASIISAGASPPLFCFRVF